MLRKARASDIDAIAAMYGRHVAEAGYGPIADMGAIITASVMKQPLVLPYDALFNVQYPRFDIDFYVAETSDREMVGFYINKTWLRDDKESVLPHGVATELWFLAVVPRLRGLGIGLQLVRDAIVVNKARTRGRGGLLARLIGRNAPMRRLLELQGFIEIEDDRDITQVWLNPRSEDEDDFADIIGHE